MKIFDHENLSTKAQSKAKELPRALLLDSSALGLLRMDDNQTAEDLLRIIGRSAKAEFGDETVEINSLVHFLWATAKGPNPTAPAFGERKWDKKTLLQISQLKVQLHATEREVLFDQTQEEEQAEDGKPAADRDREEAAEEELAEEEEDSSLDSSDGDGKSPLTSATRKGGSPSTSKSQRTGSAPGGATVRGSTGGWKKTGGTKGSTSTT